MKKILRPTLFFVSLVSCTNGVSVSNPLDSVIDLNLINTWIHTSTTSPNTEMRWVFSTDSGRFFYKFEGVETTVIVYDVQVELVGIQTRATMTAREIVKTTGQDVVGNVMRCLYEVDKTGTPARLKMACGTDNFPTTLVDKTVYVVPPSGT